MIPDGLNKRIANETKKSKANTQEIEAGMFPVIVKQKRYNKGDSISFIL